MLNSILPPAEKKTVRIDAFVRVSAAGHACAPRMGWESPFVTFKLDDGTEYTWHSDNVTDALRKFGINHSYELRGKDFGVSMLVRGNKVWRMTRIYPL